MRPILFTSFWAVLQLHILLSFVVSYPRKEYGFLTPTGRHPIGELSYCIPWSEWLKCKNALYSQGIEGRVTHYIFSFRWTCLVHGISKVRHNKLLLLIHRLIHLEVMLLPHRPRQVLQDFCRNWHSLCMYWGCFSSTWRSEYKSYLKSSENEILYQVV